MNRRGPLRGPPIEESQCLERHQAVNLFIVIKYVPGQLIIRFWSRMTYQRRLNMAPSQGECVGKERRPRQLLGQGLPVEDRTPYVAVLPVRLGEALKQLLFMLVREASPRFESGFELGLVGVQ